MKRSNSHYIPSPFLPVPADPCRLVYGIARARSLVLRCALVLSFSPVVLSPAPLVCARTKQSTKHDREWRRLQDTHLR